MVSNILRMRVHPSGEVEKSSRRLRDAAGRLNGRLAALCAVYCCAEVWKNFLSNEKLYSHDFNFLYTLFFNISSVALMNVTLLKL